jgi:transposase InsO family protein
MEVDSLGGKRYWVTFIDVGSRRPFVYFLRQKSEAAEALRGFQHLVETQTGRKIRGFRSDRGGEYLNATVDALIREGGIV